MTVHPCLNCHRRRDCEIKREKLKGVRGLKLTAIRFRCTIPQDDFPPGCRVLARVHNMAEWWSRSSMVTLSGTVMKHWKNGVLIAVDFDSRESYLENLVYPDERPIEMGDVISVRTDRLERLPEPSVRVCKSCGTPENREELRRRDGQPWGTCEECEMLEVKP